MRGSPPSGRSSSGAGNGGKGIAWNTDREVAALRRLNGEVAGGGPTDGMARIESDIDAAEVILMLAPETNGEVAVRAWEALGAHTGRDHTHLAAPKKDEKIRFRDVVAQPRKIISSPTWSGLESEHVCYNAGYTNVHELIPWRTLTGRQQLYQDHPWMRAFGESLPVYRPPIDTRTVASLLDAEGAGEEGGGRPRLVLNFITPHQKWGIHSTYSDNLLMLTLNRGGPVVWLSETDAARVGIEDNDWVEAYNANGALTARAVVSQRIREGTVYMYHAQEKTINTPGSEMTGRRGGIHNSVTRTITKPTHMIGGYAQLSYGFNYYGTVGGEPGRVRDHPQDGTGGLAGPAGGGGCRHGYGGRVGIRSGGEMSAGNGIAMILNRPRAGAGVTAPGGPARGPAPRAPSGRGRWGSASGSGPGIGREEASAPTSPPVLLRHLKIPVDIAAEQAHRRR